MFHIFGKGVLQVFFHFWGKGRGLLLYRIQVAQASVQPQQR
jgi:hypothetical protein